MNKLNEHSALVGKAVLHCWNSKSELARRINKVNKNLNVTPQVVYHWINKYYQVTPKHAKAIEEVTDGNITAYEFHPDVFDAPKLKKSA